MKKIYCDICQDEIKEDYNLWRDLWLPIFDSSALPAKQRRLGTVHVGLALTDGEGRVVEGAPDVCKYCVLSRIAGQDDRDRPKVGG